MSGVSAKSGAEPVKRARKKAAVAVPAVPRAPRELKLAITERTLQKAAKRLIDTPLVSVEIDYLQRTLGNSETESAIDAAVTGVRRLPWATIAAGS